MARAVVLYFQDNADAEDFIRQYDADARFGDYVLKGWADEVVGLYPVPTVFCDPSDPVHRGKGKTGRGYTRGEKWGWWVCAVCKKPHGRASNNETLIRSVIGQSKNLIGAVREGVEVNPKA